MAELACLPTIPDTTIGRRPCQKCVRDQRTRRWQSARDLLHDLDDVSRTLTSGDAERVRRAGRDRFSILGADMVFAIALIGRGVITGDSTSVFIASEVSMVRWNSVTSTLMIALATIPPAITAAQTGGGLAELGALRERVAHADTRVRVAALHRVWSIGLASPNSDVKLASLGLLTEPAGSSSDHIRMPAVYAIAEIANSTDDSEVKVRALAALGEPLQASQVPIRDVAIDAVNSITRSGKDPKVSLAAVGALAPAINSGNNGVRIPAINAVVRAVESARSASAGQTALDALVPALESHAATGGLEVRMMAIYGVERIGRDASDVATKTKAMGLLQSSVARGSWEPEARQRAQDAVAVIERSMKQP